MCKNEYRLQLYKVASCPFEIDFKCTSREADKLFFSLAFCCTDSNIVAARLYRCCRDKLGRRLQYTLVNQFDTKSAAHMLVNWLAEHILVGR